MKLSLAIISSPLIFGVVVGVITSLGSSSGLPPHRCFTGLTGEPIIPSLYVEASGSRSPGWTSVMAPQPKACGPFLFIQSQLLLHSAASDNDMVVCHSAHPQISILFRRPDWLGNNTLLVACVLHTCSIASAVCAYFSLFHSNSSPISVSKGTVSPTMHRKRGREQHLIRPKICCHDLWQKNKLLL